MGEKIILKYGTSTYEINTDSYFSDLTLQLGWPLCASLAQIAGYDNISDLKREATTRWILLRGMKSNFDLSRE
jgi:hypothetical protein